MNTSFSPDGMAGGTAAPARILMTADASPGIWTYVMELARALQPGGSEILLAVMGPALSPAQRAEVAGLRHVQVREKPFALEWMADPWHDVTRGGDWLLELEERFVPGVVHLNHYCYGSLPWSAPVLIAAHGCVLSWWQAVHGEGSPQSWTRYHAEVAAGLRGANIVTASTQAMLDGITRLYAPIPRLFPSQRAPRFPEFRVVPHGADAARFRPLGKCPSVLSVGNAGDGACNGELLDAVAAELRWPVVWAVEGGEPSGSWKHLRLLDARANAAGMEHQFGQAAVFALPSRYEPFGFAPLHAALAGCALVLSDIPILRETWGDAALYASPENKSAFGTALRRMVEDASLRTTMAARARARALLQSPEKMAEGMGACYRALFSPRLDAVEARAS